MRRDGYTNPDYQAMVEQEKDFWNRTCLICGYHYDGDWTTHHNIILHHVNGDGEDDDLYNRLVICDVCHDIIHHGAYLERVNLLCYILDAICCLIRKNGSEANHNATASLVNQHGIILTGLLNEECRRQML